MTADSSRPLNILLVGVGGQGTILASELLCQVLLNAGYDVKKSEVHGMSQRGGRVESHVRFGERVHSPLIVRGEADFLVGFELSETLRSMDWLAETGEVIADNTAILPYTSQVGQSPYPFDTIERIEGRGIALTVVDGRKLALEAGSEKAANTVIMGALAKRLPVPRSVWEEAIRANMPESFVDLNLKALGYGFEY